MQKSSRGRVEKKRKETEGREEERREAKRRDGRSKDCERMKEKERKKKELMHEQLYCPLCVERKRCRVIVRKKEEEEEERKGREEEEEEQKGREEEEEARGEKGVDGREAWGCSPSLSFQKNFLLLPLVFLTRRPGKQEKEEKNNSRGRTRVHRQEATREGVEEEKESLLSSLFSFSFLSPVKKRRVFVLVYCFPFLSIRYR